MNEKSGPDHRENDEAERKRQDGSPVPHEPVFRNAPAVEKQKRGEEQQEKRLPAAC